MNIKNINEPLLQFGSGEDIDPKSGIYTLGPYDKGKVRPEKIKLGVIGRSDSVEKVLEWLEYSKGYIKEKASKLPRLYPGFPGFNQKMAFESEIVYDDGYIRKIKNSEFDNILKNSKDENILKNEIIDVYLNEIKFLSKNKRPDVILCVISEKLIQTLLADSSKEEKGEEDEEESNNEENNFRRLLKARAMAFNIPIQILRDRIAEPTSEMQDPSTVAWNFYTALYYKAAGTPWALSKTSSSIVCFAGISFYRSRDKSTIQTSVTQIFNEHGKGVILRGAPIVLKKGDKEPHLSNDQAFQLMNNSLKEYYEALKIYPQRLVIHKSSNYSNSEIEGFEEAAYKNNINAIDMVTIMPSKIKLYTNNNYPPNRGTLAIFDEKVHVLYTRGFVPYYGTYPGMYIPNPITIKVFKNDEDPELICREILALTKMNWNNTQFDRRDPITIECSRKVGEIMKYLPEDEAPQIKYSFYM